MKEKKTIFLIATLIIVAFSIVYVIDFARRKNNNFSVYPVSHYLDDETINKAEKVNSSLSLWVEYTPLSLF